jgi:D-aminopeptidase
MSHSPADRLDRALAALPRRYPGPGGAAAVLRDGQVLARHAWGWANAERRIPFTPASLFRMCSITKQFTCAVLLDAFADPTVLDADVRARLPRLEQQAPGALHLCHNQSGLRDYWAVAMLHGSPVEAAFGDAEAARVIGGTRTLHFAPGTRYSYVNQNFRLLSDILQERTGRGFAELLRARVFDRAGMGSALLAADTRAMPDGTEGYEGTPAGGFRAAENRVLWTGDAGLGASLDDMIAWERHIDATRDDPGSLHARLSAPVCFADGTPAAYGFGLNRRPVLGQPAIGHGGALRGWRSHRMYLPQQRVSVVVMFNHLSDAHLAAEELLAAVLHDAPPVTTEEGAATEEGVATEGAVAAPDWLGAYTEPESGLSARIEMASKRAVRLRFGHSAETLALRADGSAAGGGTTLRPVVADGPRERECLDRAAPLPGHRRRGYGGALSLRGTGGRHHGRRRGRRAVRRIFRLPGARADGAAASGRAGCLGAALSARAGPHAARRLDAGVPPRRCRAGRGAGGGLLAGPAAALRADRLTSPAGRGFYAAKKRPNQSSTSSGASSLT